MKTVKHLVLATIVSLVGFAQTGSAAAGPRVSRPRTTEARPVDRPAVETLAKAKLSCGIWVYADEKRQQPLRNGMTRKDGVNLEEAWMEVWVLNKGERASGQFKNELTYRLGNGPIRDEEEFVLDLPPKFRAVSFVRRVDMNPGDTLRVKLKLDLDGEVDQPDGVSNACHVYVKNAKLH